VIRDRAQIAAATEILTRHGIGTAQLDEHTRRLTVPAEGGAATLVAVVRDLGEAAIEIDDVGIRRPTLDDVFLALTGHASVEEEVAA
jgi:ABC-2 type transport system ATP-binding protein